MTPLLAATRDSWHGRPEAVMTLLANGADSRATDSDGNTPLHHAARSSDPGVAALLRDAAAEVDALNNEGWSPLAVACQVGNWRLARFLLERGARSEPAEGTPVLLAAAATEDDDPAGVQLLLKHEGARRRARSPAPQRAARGGIGRPRGDHRRAARCRRQSGSARCAGPYAVAGSGPCRSLRWSSTCCRTSRTWLP
jgi:ankyrin repeat protein